MSLYGLKIANACVWLVALTLVACGEGPGSAVDAETALGQRVQERWQALLRRDYDAAYENYVSPTYRAVFTQQHFYRGYGEQLRRDRVEVARIDFTDETESAAKVLVNIYFTTEIAGELQQLSGEGKEYWAKLDGQWYLVPKSSGGL
ncbi:hypothetical protein [Candidatus Thiosymbion oneisti]|uniref:hypothetical protein n=1 Tax=Candidatus Thiosymbion oneisti TaxID=589554 RepID=UPI000B802646|nr:hypothetical protein [Candidatus Thiosymbion oneisti]